MCAPFHLLSTNPKAPRQSKLPLRQDQLAQAALSGQGCTFSRPHREQNPTPRYSPAFPKAGRLTDPKHKATLQDRKEMGACSLPALPFSMLRKSGCKERDVRLLLWVSKHHFSVNTSFCSYTRAEPGTAQLRDETWLSLARTQLSAPLPSYTLKTNSQQAEREGNINKTKPPSFSVFLLILY